MAPKCFRCGRPWSKNHHCPAKSQVCQKCGNYGHFAQACFSKTASDSDDGWTSYEQPTRGKKRARFDTNENNNHWDFRQSKRGANDSAMKNQAISLYNQGHYLLALEKYTLIIASSPLDAMSYGNRSDCYLMLKNYAAAFADAKTSIKLWPTYIKAHCRVIQLAMMFGDNVSLQASINKIRQIDPGNGVFNSYNFQITAENLVRASEAIPGQNFVQLLSQIDQWLLSFPLSLELKISKLRCLLNLQWFTLGAPIAQEILMVRPEESSSHYVLGRFFYDTDIDKSIFHYEKSFAVNPGQNTDRYFYERAKMFMDQKAEANRVYASGDYARAYDLYRSALYVDLANSAMRITLLFNMAQASYKLKDYDSCLRDLNETLSLQPIHVKALMLRAKCYMEKQMYQKALEDLETARNYEKNGPLCNEITDMLANVRWLINSLNDYHWILGVSKSASLDEITRVYWKLMKEHHPDRHANATHDMKQFHATKCKEITRAYRLLKEKLTSQDQGQSYGFYNS